MLESASTSTSLSFILSDIASADGRFLCVEML